MYQNKESYLRLYDIEEKKIALWIECNKEEWEQKKKEAIKKVFKEYPFITSLKPHLQKKYIEYEARQMCGLTINLTF